MEADDVRLRLQRLYKLTYDEAATLVQTAIDNRRKERLLQVRQQSRELALTTNRKVKTAERSALAEMSNTLEEEWKQKQRERLRLAEEEFNEALRVRGEAHAVAKQLNQNKRGHQLDRDLEKKRIEDANHRYQVAVAKLRSERKRAAEENSDRQTQRNEALEKERIRAAAVAALGTPENLKPKQKSDDQELRPKVSLHNNDVRNKDSFYDQPVNCVVPATSSDNLIDAFKAAAEQAQLVEERLKDASIRHSEADAKSTVRGENALRKVRLDASKASLESHLEILRRKEFQRQRGGSMAATAKRLTTTAASRQFQMEQLVVDAIGGNEGLRLDPDLDISSATDGSEDQNQEFDKDKTLTPDEEEETTTPEPEDDNLRELTQVPSILRSGTEIGKPKEFSVRFNDEQRQLVELFESQKREMEQVLEQAKEEHAQQLRELELAQAETIGGTIDSYVESTLSDESETAGNIIKQLDEVKSYQEKLLQKHSDQGTNSHEPLSSYDDNSFKSGNSIASIQVNDVDTTTNPEMTPEQVSTLHRHIGLGHYTPPTFHESMFDATKIENSSLGQTGLINMEDELKVEQELVARNEEELQKLRLISENLERQMMGLTMSSTGPINSIVVNELSSSNESYLSERTSSTIHPVTPAQPSLEKLNLNQSGVTDSAPTESTPRSMVRKVSKKSKISNSSLNETSYMSLPTNPSKFGRFNSSSSSSLSSISRDSQNRSTASLIGISKLGPSEQESNKSVLIGITKEPKTNVEEGLESDRVKDIIRETWEEILANDNGGRGLSLPSLSVTPISSVNETPNIPPSYEDFHSISSEASTPIDPESLSTDLSETETEILTKILLERFNLVENQFDNGRQPSEEHQTASSSKSSENSANVSIPPGIGALGQMDFNVSSSPVKLSEIELNELPDMSTTIEDDSANRTDASPSSSK